MRFKTVSWVALAAGLVLLLPPSASAETKVMLAHYMPWFVAKPYSASWGWHWTMNHYSPDTIINGKRQIASWYYPLIGPYDSSDPAVLEYHVLLMKLAGIDGVTADWYGKDNYADYAGINRATLALLDYTQKAGLSFSLCYEDATIQNEINGNFITAGNAVAQAQQTMRYAQTNYFNQPNTVRLNHQPVLLNFGPRYFATSSQWQAIFSVLSASNQPAFFTEDNRLQPVAAGAFDWPPMWTSQTNAGVVAPSALESYLAGFDQKAAPWPASVSSAFPRFHDIYQQAGVSSSYGYLDDRNGDTLRSTLGRALTNASPIIQLVTWNDFGEGTILEPTLENGYRDLGIIQDFRRQYLDANFAGSTNDLTLATRLFHLRRQYTTNAIVSAELDRVFAHLVSGDLPAARLQLGGLEVNRPVIGNLAAADGQLSFSIGGYLSDAGFQIQTSSDLAAFPWQTVTNFPASTNQATFTTPILPEGPPTFFRVRNSGP